MGNYAISVITPAHNTNPEMFRKCFESLKEQTIGFEKIEWVVVLHNCDDEHKDALLSIVEGYDNVKTELLYNDIYSPSSPRNRGLDIATADYVGLLDADDRYTPDCISRVLNYIKTTDADICHFRRRVELEKASDIVLNDTVLWDQTQETIIVNKDTWEADKLFVGLWGLCTHKVYRKAFLDKNDIRFREEIPFGEDGDFTVKAYALADKICLTPQLIGYVYYINSESMAQTLVLDDDRLIRYCEGFVKFFKRCEEYKIEINEAIAELMLFVVFFLNNSKDLKPETRQKVKEILGDYVKKMKPVKPSKMYPLAKAQAMNSLPHLMILGESGKEVHFIYKGEYFAPQSIEEHQDDKLLKLLREGVDTDYGKRYGFDSIFSLEDYQEKLPLTDYDTYRPMIGLTVHIAEQGIFTKDDITSYIISHGALGTSRRMPVTETGIKRYVDAFEGLIGEGRFFPMFESLPHNPSGKTMDTKYTNTLTGLTLTSYLHKQLKRPGNHLSVVAPNEILFPSELNNFEYIRFLFALRDKQVETIFAPNAWILYSGIRRLLNDYKLLCEDIRRGMITETGSISDELIDSIRWRLMASPERADELEKLFETKGENITLKDIWPKLYLVIADGTGSYRVHLKKSERYLAGVNHSNGILADECGMYGVAEENSDLFKLDPRSCFYEFLPVDGGDACFVFGLEEGKDYRLVVTTDNGLYRYKTDTFVRCAKKSDEGIFVEKICPILYDISAMDGIREEDVYNTVLAVEEKYGLSICDYSLLKETEDGEYILVMEPEFEQDKLRTEEIDREELRAFLTDTLGKKSTGSGISVIEFFCEPESFFLHRDIKMHRWNVLPDDIKPQHMVEYGMPRVFK